METNEKLTHMDDDIVLKRLLILLRGICCKHHGDFYCLNCIHSLVTEKKLNHIKKYVEIKTFVTL